MESEYTEIYFQYFLYLFETFWKQISYIIWFKGVFLVFLILVQYNLLFLKYERC